jgi:hypothetical protein
MGTCYLASTVLIRPLTLPCTHFPIHYSVKFNHSMLSLMQILTALLTKQQSNTDEVPDLTCRGSDNVIPERCYCTCQEVVTNEHWTMVEWWLTGESWTREYPVPVPLIIPWISYDVTGTDVRSNQQLGHNRLARRDSYTAMTRASVTRFREWYVLHEDAKSYFSSYLLYLYLIS